MMSFEPGSRTVALRGVASPDRMEPVAMGGVAGHHHLGKALRMAEQLEDQELARKFQRGKCIWLEPTC